tara:strand:- start:27 stop:1496 length:1470 start_codon:yes stop_codon:yes gene_type:complete
MTRVKLDTPAFADQSVDTRTIKDGTIIAQDVSGSITNAKLANSSISINGSSVSLGGSASIIVFLDWQAVTVADGSTTLTAEAGKGYFLDTNAGVIEVFLPSSPSRGDTIALVDYSGTFATNQLIINTGGQKIDSSTSGSEFKVTTNNSIVELVYVDANKGWQVNLNQAAGTTPDSILTPGGVYQASHIVATGGTITETGDFRVHTFTGDGTFAVNFAGNGTQDSPSIVDYLVVAGGGGGGQSSSGGGGGGAGGFRESLAAASPTHTASPHTASPLKATTGITVTTGTSYPVTVGGGGTSKAPGPTSSGPGSNSVFSTITSTGGGRGGCQVVHSNAAGAGGSGGGAPSICGPNPAGAGNTPPVSPSQGNPGGVGNSPSGQPDSAGGGGGGATATGGTGGGPKAGGAGATTEITGSPVAYAGGGGGASRAAPEGAGPGGTGGGGAGQAGGPPAVSTNGSANTGGGGGGKRDGCHPLGLGGKGIVVIRYKFQ